MPFSVEGLLLVFDYLRSFAFSIAPNVRKSSFCAYGFH